jgi:formylglycine-generating enzyme required for sulfatase activity
MERTLLIALGLLVTLQPRACAQWLPVTHENSDLASTEGAGAFIHLEYDLDVPDLTPAAPAYVFVEISLDDGKSWSLLNGQFLRGDGVGIVESPGHKKNVVWGADQLGITDMAQVDIEVRAIRMVRVPGGGFNMDLLPGGGFDSSKSRIGTATLPTFYCAKCATTVGMYADYLNAAGKDGRGWNKQMSNPERCGIRRNDDGTYTVAPGRENYPVNYVSWYAAEAFLAWAGLSLPTEAEFQKVVRGGLFLDGDETRKVPNPRPQRKYPWGDEAPDADGIRRCNCDFDKNGSGKLAPVGSYSQFNSPYGACDLVGNVAEWTLDTYTTSYHAGLDGYRMLRGGSFMDPPSGCDAVSGASQLPAKSGRIYGFRGVLECAK